MKVVSQGLPRAAPKYLLADQQVKNFSGTTIVKNTKTISNNGLLAFDHSAGIRELIFRAPGSGRLVPTKSKMVIDITCSDTGSNDTHPFNYSQSLFSNKYYLINGQRYCDNKGQWNYFHSLMSSVHYDADFLSNSSGYKVGVNQSTLATGSTLRMVVPLVNPKYLDQEDLLRTSFDLSSVKTFEVAYEIPTKLYDILSGANQTNITISAKMDWYIVYNNLLAENLLSTKKVYTRYHFDKKPIQPNETSLIHSFNPSYGNLKYILLAQRTAAVINGTGTAKYTNNFVQSGLDNLQVFIADEPLFAKPMELSQMTDWIINLEETFGRDHKHPLGSYIDFTQTTNLSKAFLAIPLSLDSEFSSGKNTAAQNKTLRIEATLSGVSELTYCEYFFVYEEIMTIDPKTKTVRISKNSN